MAAIKSPPPPPARLGRPDPQVRMPFLKFSGYDIAISALLALGLAILGWVLWAFGLFYATIPETPPVFVPLEMMEQVTGGGDENGDPNETLDIQTPDEPREGIMAQEAISEIVIGTGIATEVAERMDTFAQVEQSGTDTFNGSATGTGKRRPLGFGPGNGGGVAPELRWFIRFADGTSLTEYAKQLDFFGIELGSILPDGRMAYISGLAGTPKPRYAMSGKDEKRLYMKWEGGERRSADEKIFQKSGLQVGKAVIFHFYPQQTEQLLLNLEFNYAKRNLKEVRRTYFLVNTKGKGYEFVVSRQLYLK